MNWAGQVEFGASWTTGVVSSLGLLGSVDVERKGIGWTHKIQLRGDVQDTDGARAVEPLTASWQPRHAFGECGYVFGLAQYEHDPALGCDNRFSVGLGAGLRFGQPNRFRVLVDGGPAVRRTDRQGNSRTSLAGRGSADLNWPLTSRVNFEQRVAAFYEDGSANGLAASALDTQVSSKLKLRLSHEYRFENGPGTRSGGSASRASLVFGLLACAGALSQLAFMFDETLLNVFFRLLPSPCIADIAATAISAAMRPYSMAVAPRVLRHRV